MRVLTTELEMISVVLTKELNIHFQFLCIEVLLLYFSDSNSCFGFLTPWFYTRQGKVVGQGPKPLLEIVF